MDPRLNELAVAVAAAAYVTVMLAGTLLCRLAGW